MPESKDAKKIMSKMKSKYGKKEGERIYYATANKQGRDFADFHKEEFSRKLDEALDQLESR
jgi:hypothetical protein